MLIPAINPTNRFRTKAVHLEKSSNQYFQALVPPGCASNNQGTFSVWFKIYDINDALERFFIRMTNGGTTVFYIDFTATILTAKNRFGTLIRTAAGSNLAGAQTDTAETVDGLWHHCMVSWRRSPSVNLNFYRDGAADGAYTSIPLAGSTDWTQVDTIHIGLLDGSPDNYFKVDLAEMWFDTAFVNDPTKFRDPSTGKPRNIGADGSGVTGSQPPIYLSGGGSTFGLNKGYGPNFTAINIPTDATTSPTD